MATEKDQKLFPTIGEVAHGDKPDAEAVDAECVAVDAEDDDRYMPTVIESLCMQCEKMGETRLLLVNIPFFREVVLMSFECPHCNYRNNEVQPAQEIREKGCRFRLRVTRKEDLDRAVVLADSATFKLEELEFERPAGKGEMTNIEGILRTALDGIQEGQEDRRAVDPEQAAKLDTFIAELTMYLAGVKFPFHVTVDDPSGNSFLENQIAPKKDPNLKETWYERTLEQSHSLGLYGQNHLAGEEEEVAGGFNSGENYHQPAGGLVSGAMRGDTKADDSMVNQEVLTLPVNCSNCQLPGESRMCVTDIPFFREIVIMAFNCDHCGFKTNEIKSGGAIPSFGHRAVLKVVSKEEDEESWTVDMNRDIIKSNSAGIQIPELDLEVENGSLGGMYTTLEGILEFAQNKFFDGAASGFLQGDSMEIERKNAMESFREKFEQIRNGEIGFTFVMEDPLACSYIYSPFAPDPDPRLTVSEYERTADENDQLGLTDMNVDHYDDQATAESGIASQDKNAEPNKPTLMDQTNRNKFLESMRNLQAGGSEAHPNADVVTSGTQDVTETLEHRR